MYSISTYCRFHFHFLVAFFCHRLVVNFFHRSTWLEQCYEIWCACCGHLTSHLKRVTSWTPDLLFHEENDVKTNWKRKRYFPSLAASIWNVILQLLSNEDIWKIWKRLCMKSSYHHTLLTMTMRECWSSCNGFGLSQYSVQALFFWLESHIVQLTLLA